MKKTKFLVALACLGLLITGCGQQQASSSESKPASSSQAPASSQASSSESSSSSEAPAETYYEVPFGDANTALNESSGKWGKGKEYTWKFTLTKNYTKVQFAVGAQMSSSSHGDRSLFTNHEGASSSDSFESNEANDGTPRIELKVNGTKQTLTTMTYEEAGLTNSEMNYFKISEFPVNAGEVNVSLTTNANVGYRLILGEGARLYYKASDESATPIVMEEGYDITFTSTHSEIWVYESGQDYTVDPVKTNTTKSRDEEGKVTKWIEPEEADTLEPQVNFKVICEEGYEIDADCITITGTYNKIKIAESKPDQHYWIVRVTKIQTDLTITVTPKVHQEDAVDGYEITFALTNCTVKVYVGPKDETGSNLDSAQKFYTRAKTSPYDYSKASDCQFNFEIIPNTGYTFNDGVTWGEATEVSSSAVSFIAPSANYNKLKKSTNGGYTLTKVAGALTITAVATAA